MSLRALWCTLGLAAALAGSAEAQTKLLRFPDLSGSSIVFVYGGDLWKAQTAGGLATRLTAHPGLELFPKFSPDGQWIAFTGQYDGDEQVYLIPATGGEPRQLTFYPARGPLPPRWGYDNQVYGFTPDGKKVLFRSFRDTWDISDSRLYTVPVTGGPAEPLPMPVAGAGSYSPDGSQIAYSPLARDFRSWKRYQGGWASDLHVFDLAQGTSWRLTSDPRSDRDPMWIGAKVYFTSDRSGTLNLYAQEPHGTSAAQLTTSTSWDVRWPSADEKSNRIVYELGGELQVFDVATGQSRYVPINVPDDGVNRRPARISAAEQIEDAGLSPKGERVVFAARGDIFTVPIEKGPTRNLTRSSDAHDRLPAWSPDGAKVAFVSDRSGEEEIYLVAQDGSAPPEALTSGSGGRLYPPTWSPDGKHLAWADKNGKLFVLTLADKKKTEVADDPRRRILDYTWSAKGNHLAFSMVDALGVPAVHVWSGADGKTRKVTDGFFGEYSPAWDAEGDYLFYLSDRNFVPMIDGREWNYANDRQTLIYALALRKDVKHPFPPQSDEVTVDGKKDEAKAEKKEDKKEDKKDAEGKKDDPPFVIDFEGLGERLAQVPVPAENYGSLFSNKGNLFYVQFPGFYYGREGVGEVTLKVFSLEKRETKTLAEGIQNGAISADGSKLLVNQQGSWYLMDAAPGGESSKKTISTRDLYVDRIPAEEWETIFDEVWRRFRDFFYVENMHGYDWQAIGTRYRALLPYVAHRSDLNYVLGEMIAELNVSHAYVTGGDYDLPDRPRVALPGARWQVDPASGRYKITRILEGDNSEGRYRSPLKEIGVGVSVGDYLLAVDGEELKPTEDPYRLLRHKADRPVELTINSKPSLEGARKVTFKPLDDEQSLIYHGWVQANFDRVSKATGGRVGYLHIPDMGPDGIREFTKWYYPQVRTEGLVVDVRGNGGGNVSQMIINRLSREILGADFQRGDGYAGTYPNVVYWGHMACLLSETSASDGDIFPYMFRRAGLGPLIGKRSWGGVVGITDHGPLLDGGGTNVPEFASASLDGRYIIEGHGVDPDIEVENRPEDLLAGRDPQLERGIEEVMKKIQAEPRKLPARPADPIRRQDRYDGVPNLKKP